MEVVIVAVEQNLFRGEERKKKERKKEENAAGDVKKWRGSRGAAVCVLCLCVVLDRCATAVWTNGDEGSN